MCVWAGKGIILKLGSVSIISKYPLLSCIVQRYTSMFSAFFQSETNFVTSGLLSRIANVF